jgi:hypothetical protein
MRYRLAAGVRWAVDRAGVNVAGAGGTFRLGYPEAAVWDLAGRGYRFARIVALTGAIGDLDPPQAEALVRSAFADWAEAGLLERDL